MPLDKLKQMVHDLDAELVSVDAMDDETRQLLEEALEDIQHALRQQNTEKLHDDTVSDKLRQAVRDFEATHPNVAGVLNRMIDVLGQLGI